MTVPVATLAQQALRLLGVRMVPLGGKGCLRRGQLRIFVDASMRSPERPPEHSA
jgi:hypothetical protein